MKRIFSILLALTLMLALAVPAFATTIEPTQGESSKNVTATYKTSADEVVHTYYVTVEWNVPAFTYNFQGKQYTWQTGTMNYKETGSTGTAGWGDAETHSESETKNITLMVTNRSDMAVNCSAAILKNASQPETLGVTYQKTGTATSAAAAITVEDGKWGEKTDPNSGEATKCDLSGTITVSGIPDKNQATLGTITVTISK